MAKTGIIFEFKLKDVVSFKHYVKALVEKYADKWLNEKTFIEHPVIEKDVRELITKSINDEMERVMNEVEKRISARMNIFENHFEDMLKNGGKNKKIKKEELKTGYLCPVCRKMQTEDWYKKNKDGRCPVCKIRSDNFVKID